MSAQIIAFPRIPFAQPEQQLDQNLAKHFTEEEIYGMWEKIHDMAGYEVLSPIRHHEPEIENSMSTEELAKCVSQTTAFFLRRAADRVITQASRKRLLSKLLL